MQQDLPNATNRWPRWLSVVGAALHRCAPAALHIAHQSAHRAGSLALLLLLAGAILQAIDRPTPSALWSSALVGAAGILTGLLALALAHYLHHPRREAIGVTFFSAACTVLALFIALLTAP